MSRASPNTANVWMECQASPRLAGLFPDLNPDSPERLEGREWHAAAEALAKNGELVGTLEQQDGAQMWVDALVALGPLESWRIEKNVLCSAIHPEIPDGRPDALAIQDHWIRSADYKAGHGFVDEYEHWQQVIYLLAVVKSLGVDYSRYQYSTTVVQPRYYGPKPAVRTWEFTGAQLAQFEKAIVAAAESTRKGDAPARVGRWCGKCAGARGCALLNEAAAGIADWAGVARPFEPVPASIGAELRMLHIAQKLLKDRTAAMEAQALHLLGTGVAIPGYEMDRAQSREAWLEPEKAINVAAMLGVDIAKPREPITPAQARAKGVDATVIKRYSHRPPGALKLQPVDFNHTKRIFENGK